jgi:hypothetical protein
LIEGRKGLLKEQGMESGLSKRRRGRREQKGEKFFLFSGDCWAMRESREVCGWCWRRMGIVMAMLSRSNIKS